MPNQTTTPEMHADVDDATTTSVPAIYAPAISQSTHPSTASHEPGDLGRAAITETTRPDPDKSSTQKEQAHA